MNSIPKKQSKKKIIAIVLLVLLVLGLVGAGVAYAINQRNKQEAAENYGSDITTPSEDTPDADKNENSSSPSISNSKDEDGDETDSAPAQNNTPPATPIGTFVSNHQPNLDGSPRPSTINSTCTTSARITCFIRFTKGQEVRTLAAQTTDASGNTAWTWNINDIGLGEGEWQIEAVARNGSVDATASDPTPLKVEK